MAILPNYIAYFSEVCAKSGASIIRTEQSIKWTILHLVFTALLTQRHYCKKVTPQRPPAREGLDAPTGFQILYIPISAMDYKHVRASAAPLIIRRNDILCCVTCTHYGNLRSSNVRLFFFSFLQTLQLVHKNGLTFDIAGAIKYTCMSLGRSRTHEHYVSCGTDNIITALLWIKRRRTKDGHMIPMGYVAQQTGCSTTLLIKVPFSWGHVFNLEA